MSDLETSAQEAAAAATASDAPIDIDDLPSDAEASTSAVPSKQAGPGRPKGKSTTTAASTAKDGEQGLQSYLLPRSTITKIAKSAVPPNTKLQKELPTALTRSAVVFISYLTSLAQEQAAAANVKTIKPDHVLEALPELDWGEADTIQLRKHLKKQLKAYRAIAKAKKEGKPVPGPSTGSGRGRGRPKKVVGDTATETEAVDIEDDEETATTSQSQRQDGPDLDIQYKSKSLLKKPTSGNEESSEDEDDVNVRKIIGDGGDAEDEGEESPIEDEEDEEEQAEEDDDEDDLIDDADEEVDPNDFEEEMGQRLEDRRTNGEDQDMDN